MQQFRHFGLSLLSILFCLVGILSEKRALSQDTAYVVLASGSYGSPYYEVASDIATCLNGKFKSSKLIAMPTNGSLDNLKRLKNRSVDMIIAQRDVLVSGYYEDQLSIKNFEIVLPLFPEGLQIFIRGSSNTYTLPDLKQKLQSGDISSFAIGPENATTHKTTRYLLDLHGIQVNDTVFDYRSPSEFIPDFAEGKVDAMAFLAASPIQRLEKDPGAIGVLTLNDSELDLMISHERNLNEIEMQGSDYPFLPDTLKYRTVGTWAFLAALTSLNDDIKYLEGRSIGDILYDEISSHKLTNDHLTPVYGRNHGNMGSSNPGPVFLNQRFNENSFFRGLPLADDLKKNLGIERSSRFPIMLAIILFLAALGAISMVRLRIDPNRYWMRYGHVIVGTVVLVLSYIILSEVILIQEREFYRLYGVKSPILDLTKQDLHKWLLISILTNYNADIFPMSLGAQVSTTASFFLLWTTGAFMLGYELVYRYINKQRKKGMKRVKHQSHIVIFGWNDRAVALISKLLRAEKSFLFKKSKKIVIVNKVVRHLLESDHELQSLHDRKKIELIHKEPSQQEALIESNVVKASTVVLLADDSSREADERTLLRALAISSYCRKHHHTSQDRIYMIAELNNPEFKSSLYSADVNEIICSAEIQNGVVIQNILNHGLSDAMHELTTYNDYNEFYTIDLRLHKSLVGKTFDELLTILRNKKILLLGIKSVHYDDKGNEIIDKEYKSKLDQNQFGIDRQLMINPFTKKEEQYVTDNDDQLVVLARNERVIKDID